MPYLRNTVMVLSGGVQSYYGTAASCRFIAYPELRKGLDNVQPGRKYLCVLLFSFRFHSLFIVPKQQQKTR
jgi:hypothetical protein